MSAVFLRLRSELRARWRSWLALALLVGLGGGAALAAAAGARRSESAYPRFLKLQKAAHLYTGGGPESIDMEQAFAKIERFPEVLEWARIDLVSPQVRLPDGAVIGLPDVAAATDMQAKVGLAFNRVKVLSGRLYRPSAPEEAVIDFTTAERYRLSVGSRLGVMVAGPRQSASFVPVRVVGIVASPGSFPAVGSFSTASIALTPAFVRTHHVELDPTNASLLIRLRRGSADIAAFQRDMNKAGLGDVDIPYVEPVATAAVQKSIRFESRALWILSALIAIAALAIVGQSLARQTVLESTDYPVLRAVGLSRRQLVELGLIRATIIAIVGALAAVVVAILLSPLTPIGLARIAEPNPGMAVDGLIVAAGAALTAVLVILASAGPAWLAARSAARLEGSGPVWTANWTARFAGRVSLPPAVSAGTRLALDPGRGRSSVPVRSAALGGTLGIAALVASLLFGTSLTYLLATPRLSGAAWDMFLVVGPDQGKTATSVIRSDPDVAGYSFPGGFVNLNLARSSVFGFLVDGKGGIEPVIADGRAPSSGQEIALGPATLRSLHTAIGRTIDVRLDENGGPSGPRVQMTVVGEAIIPSSPFGTAEQGAGAALIWDGYLRFHPETSDELPYLIRFRPDVDRDRAVSRLLQKFPDAFQFTSQRSGDLASLSRIARVPVLLSGLVAAIAAGTLVHALVSAIRRRRRDLAILKTLGFLGRQIRAAVAWQATVLVVVSLLIGVPLGIAAGRWGWRAFAENVSVLPVPKIPWVAVALIVPGVIALANLIALVPGRIAARTEAARILRSE